MRCHGDMRCRRRCVNRYGGSAGKTGWECGLKVTEQASEKETRLGFNKPSSVMMLDGLAGQTDSKGNQLRRGIGGIGNRPSIPR